MFELIVICLFVWILLGTVRLAFRVTWGLAKITAAVLSVLALPLLVGCLLFAGGIFILLPVALIASAWGVLRACI